MKKRIIILGGVVIAVVMLWSAAWLAGAHLLRQEILALAQADGVASPQLACGGLDVGGFPFRYDVECAEARIVSGDLTVAVPAVRASVRVYAPTHLLASARGPVTVNDSFTGTRQSVAFSAFEASGRLENWRIGRVSLSAKDVVWSDQLFGDALIASAPLAEVHLFDIPEQHDATRRLAALAGYARAQNLVWPGLTLSDANAELQVELTGLPDDVRTWSDPALLPNLAANGGALKVVAVRATDGDSVLDAEGNLVLTQQGLLDGTINVTSTGVAERVGALLQEPWRTLVIGTPTADGSYANQLNFKAGAVFSGLIPIAQLAPLF